MRVINNFISPESNNFMIDMLKNPDTLNIFSDASMRPRGNNVYDTCYGAVAVNQDVIVEELFRINSSSTVPAAEIRGVRCSLRLALKYRYQFRIINIFSDSQVALFGLRDYIYGWKYSCGNLINRSAKIVKNQELFIEIYLMLEELRKTNIVNLYHQPGHVENGMNSIKNAVEVFKRSNSVKGFIDYSVIRYISLYNNYVDNKSRSIIKDTNVKELIFKDPVKFYIESNLINNN